jgi:hypothetical protein
VTIKGAVQQAFNGGHLPAPTDQIRLSTSDGAMLFTYAQQPINGDGLVGTLNTDYLRFI